MADLIPVEGNPFEAAQQPGLVPVEGNPFERNYAAAEVPGAAAKNATKSGREFVGGIVDAVTHPVDTAKGIFDAAVLGPASKFMRTLGLTDALAGGRVRGEADTPEGALAKDIERQKAGFREKATDQMVDHYKGRYGGWENVKRTFAEDPVGAFSDVLGVTGMTPGRAAAAAPRGVVRAADAPCTWGRASPRPGSGC